MLFSKTEYKEIFLPLNMSVKNPKFQNCRAENILMQKMRYIEAQ